MSWFQEVVGYLAGPLPLDMHVIIVFVVLVIMAIIVVTSGLVLQSMSPRIKEWMMAPLTEAAIWRRASLFALIDIIFNVVLYYIDHGPSFMFAIFSVPASFLFFLVSGYLLRGFQQDAQEK